MFAVISDIHSNFEAFQAVIDDIDSLNIKRIICLGDVIGYGPDPKKCLDLAMERCEIVLMGNHDLALTTQPLGFNKAAREAIDWTRKKLKPGFISTKSTKKRWNFCQNLPDSHKENGMLFVHASPRDPITEYVEATDVADIGFGVSKKIKEIMEILEGPCFIAHTHSPGIINSLFKFESAKNYEDTFWKITKEPSLINVGSVGQPRDNDPRACYVVVEDKALKYRRVKYDTEKTATKIRAIKALDNRLADRLIIGS